ncbi:shikimate kinase [Acinetobacter sichuanensis]|uniref:shikimate kinase n=1 Tax=Acinetobacter sichuanensis TaxID=2136183 RepID=UPI00280ECC2D|nr:shikimate kinase [Acinetobacter sichuanensis]MDQ9022020.1 shikimate kinase [Acinetobacter sichuanensis]
MRAFLCDIGNYKITKNRDFKKLIIHFVGLGGSGKTTTAKSLAIKMNVPHFDLDEYFIENIGDITQFINKNGYDAYAKRNIELYIQPNYLQLKQEIENDPFTFLLIPSLDLDESIEVIVKRQLSRSYLNTSAEKEEIKVRKRFEIYHNLNCCKVLTNQLVDEVVENISVLIALKSDI